ncbi:hypothetical protein LTR95_012451 [Oleoguttula sp. CCFEE 5521]
MHDIPGTTPEEIEMRMMFQKMREFNAKNPTMLAKLWEEERRSHGASQSPQQAKATVAPPSRPKTAKAPAIVAPAASAPTISTPSSTPTAPDTSATTTAFKPFSRPKTAPPAHLMGTSATITKPATSSLWPPGKKDVLAELAAKWLTGKNPDKPMSKADLLARLDQNPNYVELCESLESVGLKFERAGFAKQLLQAVPGGSSMKSTSSVNGGSETNGATSITPASNISKKRGRPTREEMQWRRDVGLAPPAASSSSDPITKPNGDTTVSYEVPSFSLSDAAREVNNMHRQPRSARQNPLQAPARTAPSPSVSSPAPAVQSAFINIFALAASNTPVYTFDDEPAPPPAEPQPKMEVKPTPPPRPPADKEEAARKRDFSTMVDLTQADLDDDDAPPPKMQQTAPGVGVTSQQPKFGDASFQAGNTQTPQRPAAPPVQIFRLGPPAPNGSSKVLSTPMAAQPMAQPTPAPPATPKRTGPTQESLQSERIRGKMIVEPIMRDRVARKSQYDSRTIARDVLLATGRHPDMRPLNAHMNNMQRLLGERGGMIDSGGNRSDLATIRWDVIDPEPAKKSRSDAVEKFIRDEDAADADDEDDTPRNDRHTNKHSEDAPLVSVKEPGYVPKSKKKGRPFKNSTLSSVRADTSGGSTPQPTSTTRQPNTSGPRNISTPNHAAASSPAMSGSGAPVGYAAFRQLDEDGNPIKTKGRPKGWRKSVHSREAQGLPPAAAGSKPLSGSGRTSYRPPTQPLQEPEYQVYACKWVGCKAELHSLDTLRKHIVKWHGRPGEDDEYACLWTKCRVSKGLSRPATFPDITPWVKHVEKEHLEPIAWRLGDGPKSGLPETHYSDAYLSDSHGRSITPIIQPFSAVKLAPATAVDTSGLNKEARDAVRRLEARKRIVSITMGQLGCKFVNQKRRLGFLDDEDFEDEVAVEGETESESEGEGMERIET